MNYQDGPSGRNGHPVHSHADPVQERVCENTQQLEQKKVRRQPVILIHAVSFFDTIAMLMYMLSPRIENSLTSYRELQKFNFSVRFIFTDLWCFIWGINFEFDVLFY